MLEQVNPSKVPNINTIKPMITQIAAELYKMTEINTNVRNMGEESFGDHLAYVPSPRPQQVTHIKDKITQLTSTLQQALQFIDYKLAIVIQNIKYIDNKRNNVNLQQKMKQLNQYTQELQNKIKFMNQDHSYYENNIQNLTASKQAMKQQYELQIYNLKAEIENINYKNTNYLLELQNIQYKDQTSTKNHTVSKRNSDNYANQYHNIQDYGLNRTEDKEQNSSPNLSPLHPLCSINQTQCNPNVFNQNRSTNNLQRMSLRKRQSEGKILEYGTTHQNTQGLGCLGAIQQNSFMSLKSQRQPNNNMCSKLGVYKQTVGVQNDKQDHSHRLKFLMNNLRQGQQSTKMSMQGEQGSSLLQQDNCTKYHI